MPTPHPSLSRKGRGIKMSPFDKLRVTEKRRGRYPEPHPRCFLRVPPCSSPERVSQRLDQRELRHQVAARDRLHAARFLERAQQAQRDDEPTDPGDEKDER